MMDGRLDGWTDGRETSDAHSDGRGIALCQALLGEGMPSGFSCLISV